jgi:hypothetical protein
MSFPRLVKIHGCESDGAIIDISTVSFSASIAEMLSFCRAIGSIQDQINGNIEPTPGSYYVGSSDDSDVVIGRKKEEPIYNIRVRGVVWNMSEEEAVVTARMIRDHLDHLGIDL